MLGTLAAVAAIFGLLFICASITKDNTEQAVKKQQEVWEK